METIAIVCIVIGIIAVIGFSIAFFVELTKVENVESKESQEDVVINNNKITINEAPEEASEEEKVVQDEFDLDAMLAEKDEGEAVEDAIEEKEEKEESRSRVIIVREKTEEVTNAAPVENEEEKTSDKNVDLSTRLSSVQEAIEKVDVDLSKALRDLNKYERTERRMARNQKLLDKKAEDLTKLNLVLYSVTDIKNIDADKKQKQEELTEHINELKASIKDAQVYLETNKEKYENAQKMKTFFEGEKARLDADEKEILSLMGKKKNKKN